MAKYILDHGNSKKQMDRVLEKFSRKLDAYPMGACPLTVQMSLLHTSKNQTCGKCVPCRDGLPQLEKLRACNGYIGGHGSF